jgi:hypothetical protein
VKNNYLKYFIGLIPLFIVGMIRENFMLNLNYTLVNKYYHQSVSNASDSYSFLQQYDYLTLYYTKWIIQVVFSVAFFLTTYFILSKFIKEKITFVQLGLIYIISASAIIGIYFLGQIHLFVGQTAHIARILLELQHSPIIYMVLIMISIFNQKIST